MDWKDIGGLALRRGLAYLAGLLVAAGWLHSGDVPEFITIGAGILVGVGEWVYAHAREADIKKALAWAARSQPVAAKTDSDGVAAGKVLAAAAKAS